MQRAALFYPACGQRSNPAGVDGNLASVRDHTAEKTGPAGWITLTRAARLTAFDNHAVRVPERLAPGAQTDEQIRMVVIRKSLIPGLATWRLLRYVG